MMCLLTVRLKMGKWWVQTSSSYYHFIYCFTHFGNWWEGHWHCFQARHQETSSLSCHDGVVKDAKVELAPGNPSQTSFSSGTLISLSSFLFSLCPPPPLERQVGNGHKETAHVPLPTCRQAMGHKLPFCAPPSFPLMSEGNHEMYGNVTLGAR